MPKNPTTEIAMRVARSATCAPSAASPVAMDSSSDADAPKDASESRVTPSGSARAASRPSGIELDAPESGDPIVAACAMQALTCCTKASCGSSASSACIMSLAAASSPIQRAAIAKASRSSVPCVLSGSSDDNPAPIASAPAQDFIATTIWIAASACGLTMVGAAGTDASSASDSIHPKPPVSIHAHPARIVTQAAMAERTEPGRGRRPKVDVVMPRIVRIVVFWSCSTTDQQRHARHRACPRP